MKRQHWFRLLATLVVTTLLGVGCTERTQLVEGDSSHEPTPSMLATDYKVIVLVIDGARHTETFGDPTHSHVPYLWNDLRLQGTLVSMFRNQSLTATCPGHASIATGTWQLLANDGSQRPTAPTFFEYFRETTSIPQSETYVVAGKSKLHMCSYSTHPDYGAPKGATEDVGYVDDSAVYEELLTVLQTDQPRLVLACLPSVDLGGHSGVWDNYTDAIEMADILAYSLWNYLRIDPFYADQTYLFITNDHGRHDDQHGGFQNHGDDCEGCQRLMFLALGPSIRVNHTVPPSVVYTQRDICSTVGDILGFSTPYSEGVSMTEIFERTVTGIATHND